MNRRMCLIALGVVLITIFLLTACQQQTTIEQIRQQYPLYNLPDNGSAAYAKFSDMVKTADIAVYASFTQDIQTVSSTTQINPLETPDKAFNSKHPDANITAQFNLLYLHIDKTIYGDMPDSDILVCVPVNYLKDSVQPHKGDSFFFFLKKGTTSTIIQDFIDNNDSLKNYPLYSGTPRFYKTANNRILAILNLDDQKTYDMTTDTDFEKIIKTIKEKSN